MSTRGIGHYVSWYLGEIESHQYALPGSWVQTIAPFAVQVTNNKDVQETCHTKPTSMWSHGAPTESTLSSLTSSTRTTCGPLLSGWWPSLPLSISSPRPSSTRATENMGARSGSSCDAGCHQGTFQYQYAPTLYIKPWSLSLSFLSCCVCPTSMHGSGLCIVLHLFLLCLVEQY